MLEPARRRDGDVTARELPELCIPLLTSSGSSFHALTARMKNERLANSVRACGTSSCPSSVDLVARGGSKVIW